MRTGSINCLLVSALLSINAASFAATEEVSDEVIAEQRKKLAEETKDKGYGPQAPRDIDSKAGTNKRIFSNAPSRKRMNLCNIHFHKNAEHKGGQFTKYAGNGDGHGYHTGYKFSGYLSPAETQHHEAVCPNSHQSVEVGDTIEVHYVYTTADVKPGSTLGACLNPSTSNPQLRVESQVYVVVNDSGALDFMKLAKHDVVNGYHQALNIPGNTGRPVTYSGSTTGPSYNEKGSPFKVTWSVRPRVAKVNISTLGQWCKGNVFNEDHAHGVRNLVKNPDLLSRIRGRNQ